MNRSRYLFAVLASVAGFTFSAAPATQATESADPVTQVALVDNSDLSAQGGRRGGGPGFGGGMRGGAPRLVQRVGGGGRQIGGGGRQIGGGGRQGIQRVGGVPRVGGRQGVIRIEGRTGRRVGFQGRIGRFDGRIGHRIGRYGRFGYRYGRIGRIGYVPPPVVIPLPSGPGPGVRPTTVAPCPVCPVQACIVSIFGEQNLQGMTVETRDNQPRLDESGWQNQIASIMVKSGTWDFFPDLEYRGGPPLRLAPGSYAILEPNWTKSIGSFMCVR
jgi:hypothetical protein